jgi:hypothetical protein
MKIKKNEQHKKIEVYYKYTLIFTKKRMKKDKKNQKTLFIICSFDSYLLYN